MGDTVQSAPIGVSTISSDIVILNIPSPDIRKNTGNTSVIPNSTLHIRRLTSASFFLKKSSLLMSFSFLRRASPLRHYTPFYDIIA